METLLFQESFTMILLISFFFVFLAMKSQYKKTILFLYIFVILFLMFFYRVPNDKPVNWLANPKFIYSPTYGTIMDIKYKRFSTRVTIFLSLFDPHIQYIPYTGEIVSQKTQGDSFNFANDLRRSSQNVKIITHIKTTHGLITVIQSVGFLVRRLVSWVKTGDYKHAGDKLGMMKFGSRVDIEFPNSFELNSDISIKKRVKGIQTVLATEKY